MVRRGFVYEAGMFLKFDHCAHPRAPQSFVSAGVKTAVAASIGRTIAAKVFHILSPADRPARFGVLMFRRAPPPAVLS